MLLEVPVDIASSDSIDEQEISLTLPGERDKVMRRFAHA